MVTACALESGSARENDGLATRFGMLTAPRSTVVQPSPIHAGVTSDPERTLRELVTKLVEPHRRPAGSPTFDRRTGVGKTALHAAAGRLLRLGLLGR